MQPDLGEMRGKAKGILHLARKLPVVPWAGADPEERPFRAWGACHRSVMSNYSCAVKQDMARARAPEDGVQSPGLPGRAEQGRGAARAGTGRSMLTGRDGLGAPRRDRPWRRRPLTTRARG